jgi:selenocysteine lyase/cysteine desulfurase
MANAFEPSTNVPRDEFGFDHRPETDQSFENALAKARNGERLSVDDGVELLTTGTDRPGIDRERKELVLEAADRRRAEVVGEEVTFVANLNNNVTTACNTGCLFCNFKDRSEKFRTASDEDHGGFTKRPNESREIVEDALDMGIYEVTSVSGLHPAFALDAEHHEVLASYDHPAVEVNYKPPELYETDPGTYCEQMAAMINAPSAEDVALVKNISEGLSLVAHGLPWEEGDNVVINRAEFPSNRVVWESLAQDHGVEVRDVTFDEASAPEDALIDAMDRRTRILPVSSVQYGNGLRMDLARLGAACRDNGTLFCVDAIQSVGALRTDVTDIGADFLIADGHKWMLGPEGIGLFYSTPRARDQLRLHQYGWHMVEAAGDYDRTDWSVASSARRFEPGSPNTLGIYGLSASLSLHLELGTDAIEEQVLANARHLIERIQREPGLDLLTPVAENRHAGIVTFRVADADNTAVYRRLRSRGVICANRAGGIRFAPHFYNTREQLDLAVDMALDPGV